MLCSVELMLAGLSINIPMLRPFYIRFRAKYSKSSSADRSGSYNKASGSRQLQLGNGRVTPANYQAWIELVNIPPPPTFLSQDPFFSREHSADDEQADKDQAMMTFDDASSERKLTMDAPCDGIHVQKDVVISRA